MGWEGVTVYGVSFIFYVRKKGECVNLLKYCEKQVGLKSKWVATPFLPSPYVHTHIFYVHKGIHTWVLRNHTSGHIIPQREADLPRRDHGPSSTLTLILTGHTLT